MSDRQMESCARVLASCILQMPDKAKQEKLAALKAIDETLFLLTKHELRRIREMVVKDGPATSL